MSSESRVEAMYHDGNASSINAVMRLSSDDLQAIVMFLSPKAALLNCMLVNRKWKVN
jgi:hypothetical protein